MTDNWDDGSDDEWDVDDDALDAKLGLNKDDDGPANKFDDEEDLALKEKEEQEKANQAVLKKKGTALAAKKMAEKERLEDLEIARKALELEAEMESKMTLDERKMLERRRQEEGDLDMIDDAFGGGISDGGVGLKGAQQAGDKVVMKDLKDHMKHARKVAETMKVSLSTGVVIIVYFCIYMNR
jgi:translation initiation factor 3 subunit J